MKIVELILDEDQEITGVEAISIVENPAIEEDFIALESEEFKKQKKKIDEMSEEDFEKMFPGL